MKNVKIKSSFLAVLSILLFAFPWWSSIKTQSLTEITKPYLGTYECRLAQLNTQNLLDYFSYIRLELKKDGGCILYSKEKTGEEKRAEGEYIYNKERETITFTVENLPFIKREFPLKQGVIFITLRQGDKTLLMQFEHK